MKIFSLMKVSKFLYEVVYNLKKMIDEERSKVLELQKDAEKSVREKADLKLEVSSLTEEVSVSLTKRSCKNLPLGLV